MATYQGAIDQITRLGARFDATVLRALLDVPPPGTDGWNDAELTQAWIARLQTALASAGLGRPRYVVRIQPASAEHGPALVVERDQHGLKTTQVLPSGFFASGDFKAIAESAAQLTGLVQASGEVRRGGKSHPIGSFAQAYAWLMEETKRGRTISRFKGLGEMNPEQLWDTTVNPDTRRLLQVSIEDAVGADQIFSTLMGDVVEPRREFIEQNALRVSNLDV
jgi:DNA gyrase subunit B